MRRLGRIIFHMTAILALVLCLASAIFWIRSYFVGDLFRRNAYVTDGTSVRVTSSHLSLGKGILTFTYISRSARLGAAHVAPGRYPPGYFGPWSHLAQPPGRTAASPQWRQRMFLGVLFERGTSVNAVDPVTSLTGCNAALALWLPTLITALPPALWVWRWKRRRPIPGRCPKCNYDLRATPNQCPECGVIPSL